jgi:hypothetical protein
MLTPPDSDVLELYETAGGYVSGNAATDQGCVEQDVLADWLKAPVDGNELAAYIEVNPAHIADVQRTIYECGLIYIGFNVPTSLPMSAGATWDYNPAADNTIEGGHAVILTGYDAAEGTFDVVSWGSFYTMTVAFWNQFVDECYALANPAWVNSTGSSPAGLGLSALEALMQELHYSP